MGEVESNLFRGMQFPLGEVSSIGRWRSQEAGVRACPAPMVIVIGDVSTVENS